MGSPRGRLRFGIPDPQPYLEVHSLGNLWVGPVSKWEGNRVGVMGGMRGSETCWACGDM